MGKHDNKNLMYGFHPAIETIKFNKNIKEILLSKNLSHKKQKIIKKFTLKNQKITKWVDNKTLDSLTNNANHQGIAIIIGSFHYTSLKEIFKKAKKNQHSPFIIILDKIEDPHNLGSILRTADAVKADGIIIPKRRAVQLTQTVAKVSTGAIEHIPVCKVTNINDTINTLKKEGLWIFGSDMSGIDYTTWKPFGPIGLVIGNEGKGISFRTKQNVDQMITIPMSGDIDSLNASVAAAILMYHVYNFRRKN